jgi:hypothetical protein
MAIVHVLGSMKDEHYFLSLTFKKKQSSKVLQSSPPSCNWQAYLEVLQVIEISICCHIIALNLLLKI